MGTIEHLFLESCDDRRSVCVGGRVMERREEMGEQEVGSSSVGGVSVYVIQLRWMEETLGYFMETVSWKNEQQPVMSL